MDIKIDASLSRDEKYLFPVDDPLLLFSWSGPLILNNLFREYLIPSQKNKKLLIKGDDYMKYLQKDKDNYLTIKLIVKKDRRSAIKVMNIIIKKPVEIDKNITDDLIFIELEKIEIEDIILKYSILGDSIDLMRFKNIWTVENFSEEKYLNGRNEIKLRVNKDDLLIGINVFSLKLIDKYTNNIFSKEFYFEKSKKPYGGNCIVSPSIGYSLYTNFTFSIENWKSISIPLSYSLKYSNSENILIDITNGGFFSDSYTTNEIPVGYQIYLFVTDREGKQNQFPCSPKVSVNKNLPSISEFINSIFDPSKKILLIDVYDTNKISKQIENEEDDTNSKIEVLNSFFNIISKEKFLSEYNNIVSLIIKITKLDLNTKLINKILNLLEIIIDNIEFIEDLQKIDSLYLIIDNINTKLTIIKGKLIIFYLY